MTKEELLALVSSGKEKEAVFHLLELTKEDYMLNNTMIMFSARLNRNEQFATRGMMTKDKAAEERKTITESLKDFIQENIQQ